MIKHVTSAAWSSDHTHVEGSNPASSKVRVITRCNEVVHLKCIVVVSVCGKNKVFLFEKM
jgi:hypothetical protein